MAKYFQYRIASKSNTRIARAWRAAGGVLCIAGNAPRRRMTAPPQGLQGPQALFAPPTLALAAPRARHAARSGGKAPRGRRHGRTSCVPLPRAGRWETQRHVKTRQWTEGSPVGLAVGARDLFAFQELVPPQSRPEEHPCYQRHEWARAEAYKHLRARTATTSVPDTPAPALRVGHVVQTLQAHTSCVAPPTQREASLATWGRAVQGLNARELARRSMTSIPSFTAASALSIMRRSSEGRGVPDASAAPCGARLMASPPTVARRALRRRGAAPARGRISETFVLWSMRPRGMERIGHAT